MTTNMTTHTSSADVSSTEGMRDTISVAPSYVNGSKLFPVNNTVQYSTNNNNTTTTTNNMAVVNGDVVYHQTPGSGTTYISSPYGVRSATSNKVASNQKSSTDLLAFDFLTESGLEAELRELEETIHLVSRGPTNSSKSNTDEDQWKSVSDINHVTTGENRIKQEVKTGNAASEEPCNQSNGRFMSILIQYV